MWSPSRSGRSAGGATSPSNAHRTRASGPGGRTALLIDRPGAVQADLRLGAYGVDRTDPRWADLTIAGYAMGGAFLSRLNKVLREERGYTYGVRLGFSPHRSGGTYAVQGSFRTEVLVDAVREARELLDVTTRPFESAEVADAVAYYIGTSPLRFATADGVADQAASQVLGGLPSDYLDTSLAALREVTPDSATAAYTERGRRRDRQLWWWSVPPTSWPSRCGPSVTTTWSSPRAEPPGSLDRDYLPIALAAAWVAACALLICSWYFPKSPSSSACWAASKAAVAAFSACWASGLLEEPDGDGEPDGFGDGVALGLVSPVSAPESPANTWSSACCRVSPMPTC